VTSLDSLIACVAPPGRDLDLAELEMLAHEITAQPELWQEHVRHEPDRRFYVELHRESHVDVWLICWDARQETGLHDHDRSSGAVSVVAGTLLEDFLAADDDGRIGLQTVEHRAGSGFSFDATHIHDVRHDGGPAAISIHVYSPALWRMGHYALGSRGLGRVSLTYLDEVAA
jgi:predicted metal-dependent enzyme (double-stranded beta helix superfamily)